MAFHARPLRVADFHNAPCPSDDHSYDVVVPTIIRGFILLLLTLAIACGDGSNNDRTPDSGTADSSVAESNIEDPPMTFEERLLACEESPPSTCPGGNDNNLSAHGGLVQGAICQFALDDQDQWASKGAIIDALGEELPLVPARELLGDLDHEGIAIEATHPELERLEGLTAAFGWDAFDQADRAWMPQGISGSADAADDERIDDHNVLAVSWYNKYERNPDPTIKKGSRVSFIDASELAAGEIRYTHVLLVEPYNHDGHPDFRAVRIHSGGLAWVGDYLYTIDTTRGLRVFDTTRIMAIDNLDDEIGRDPQTGAYRAYEHRYALPQVGAYFLGDDSCGHRFSFMSLDKTSDVPSLITGEFHGSDIAAKLMRWPLDGDRLAPTEPTTGSTQPHDVFFAQEDKLQGAASIDGRWFMSASGQDASWGKLYRAEPAQPSDGFGWVIGPEDLMVADGGATLWSISEFPGRRYVFGVDVGSYE